MIIGNLVGAVMKPFCLLLLIILVLAGNPGAVLADELVFHESGARAAGLGGAFVSTADDVTALFYNPAGLAFLKGFRLKTNLAIGNRTAAATWPASGAVFRTAPLEIRGAHGLAWQPIKRITLGLGLFTPYNFQTSWPGTWSGDELCTASGMGSVFIRSAVSIEILKGLAVGGGFDLVTSKLSWRHILHFPLEKYPLPFDVTVESRYGVKGRGTGFHAGILWKVHRLVQIGARFRQSVDVDYQGRNIFALPLIGNWSGINLPDPITPSRDLKSLLNMFYQYQDVTAHMTLPEEIAWGVTLVPVPRLSLSFELQWNKWSRLGSWEFRSVNEDLSPEFSQIYRDFYGIAPDYGVQGVDLGHKDAREFKGGIEFRPGSYVALRAGFARHESSVASVGLTPVCPDLDRNIYSLGFGYEGPVFSIWDNEKVSDLSFDVFVRYAAGERTLSTLPGYELAFSSRRLVAGVGVGFTF